MKILDKKILADKDGTRITRYEISAPLISYNAKAGQFVVLMINEFGERIPLTIVDADKKKGVITIIVQELGFSTKLLGTLKAGDSLFSVVGPMGHATDIKNYGSVILVGGGVGIAEIYPVAKALKDAGNHVTSILGARTKELLVLEDELKSASSRIYITTDDGTYGAKGFTTDVLRELLKKDKCDLVYAVGPIPMMERVSKVTVEFGTRTIVSLNALMVDATGMCGVCRVKIGDKIKFSCVDGPEFDGHMVDWDELKKRSRVYLDKEEHICRLNKSPLPSGEREG